MSEPDALRRRVAELEMEKAEGTPVEDALKESEARFRIIFESLQDGLLLADKETRKFLLGNPAIHRMLGLSADELSGLGLNDIHPEEALPSVIAQFERLTRGEIRVAPNIPVKRKDGTVFYADISASFAIVFHGIECVMGVFRDISKRKRVEEALRESEARYRNIFENATEGIYQSSPDGHYIEVNPAFARIMGYDSPEALRDDVRDIGRQLYLDPAVREECIRTLQRQDAALFEVQFRRKDGSTGWASNNVRTVRDASGKIICFEGIAEDISERKRAEQALIKARDDLEERVSERTRELRVVNDQLRLEISEHKRTQEALKLSENQLRFLSSRLLEAHEEERKRISRELHDSIGQSLAAVKFNVESLMQEAVIKNSETLLKPLEVLVPVIQGAIEEARRIYTGLRPSILDDLGILATVGWFCREFRKSFPNLPVYEEINVDEHEIPEPIKIVIFRVLQEALNNIAKHSRADRVEVTLSMAAKTIELQVKDNGHGFDVPEIISKKAPEKGLGLTGMRERTELSGGAFLVESIIGEGTSIRARWPARA